MGKASQERDSARPAEKLAGGLVAQWHGPHALIRHRDEPPGHEFVESLPEMPGTVLVLASERARQQPSLFQAAVFFLRSSVLPHAEADTPTAVHAVWLGVADASALSASDRELLHRLAHALSVDLLVPDGTLAGKPGAGLYVGHGTGGTGWLRFRAGADEKVLTSRCPIPSWEFLVPREPVGKGGLVAEPVPAGMLVRDKRTAAVSVDERAFAVAVHGQRPRLIVGRPDDPLPAPLEVATLLGQFDPGLRARWVVAPGHPGVAEPTWIGELAWRLGEPVLMSTETPPETGDDEPFRPFVTLLRQHPEIGRQTVLGAAPAPPGWERVANTRYRFAGSEPGVVAEVVPSGLAVRHGDQRDAGPAHPFDTGRWTLWLGVPGKAVDKTLLAAAESILAQLDNAERRSVRLQVVGKLDADGQADLARIVGEAGLAALPGPPPPPRVPPVVAPVPVAPPEPAEPPRQEALWISERLSGTPVSPSRVPGPVPEKSSVDTDSPETAAPAGSRGETARSVPGPVLPPGPGQPVVTVSSTPDAVSGGPDVARHDEPEQPPSPLPPEPEVTDPAPVPGVDVSEVDTEPPEPVPQRPSGSGPLVLADRLSTEAEQTRFSVEAGETFTEALATVNAALATWPALRHIDDRAKADYVAVCLYLGTGEGVAAMVREALRTGSASPIEGYLPCLVSGIRRLPTHRRALLRQGALAEPVERQYPVGAVLTFPGFLSASVPLDVTVPGADVDLLIWPRSARRTSELGIDGPVDEAVFLAGPRFKALAVRTSDVDTESEEVRPPRTAVLVRELWPGEEPGTSEVDERDREALANLDRVWEYRLHNAVRVIDDPELGARLTAPLLDVRAAAVAGGYAMRPLPGAATAAAS
ncbi:hypothetical protein [Amycolatopsis sp. NPDC059021]|uniref:hypothetical protein n=1 Tax=Amycolatopsis sp. NPDC059021 TaxID=3346704 RepID=UPI00366B70EC